MAGGVSELGSGGWLTPHGARRAADSGQGARRTTSHQPERREKKGKRNIKTTSSFKTLFCVAVSVCVYPVFALLHLVYVSTSPAAWPSLCSGRTLHLSAGESDARCHQEHPASSYKSPPAHVRIANWHTDTLQINRNVDILHLKMSILLWL